MPAPESSILRPLGSAVRFEATFILLLNHTTSKSVCQELFSAQGLVDPHIGFFKRGERQGLLTRGLR